MAYIQKNNPLPTGKCGRRRIPGGSPYKFIGKLFKRAQWRRNRRPKRKLFGQGWADGLLDIFRSKGGNKRRQLTKRSRPSGNIRQGNKGAYLMEKF